MTTPRYEEPAAATVAEVRAALERGGSSADVAGLLVGAALHEEDPAAVQALCLELLAGADRALAAVAATCLGHLARIHGTSDPDRVVPALLAARADPAIGGRADDALDDIATYTTIAVPDQRGS
jgi:hypothetical protein